MNRSATCTRVPSGTDLRIAIVDPVRSENGSSGKAVVALAPWIDPRWGEDVGGEA
jgi:hypothetical protein